MMNDSTLPQKRCSVQGCSRKYRCKGFCELHYDRWRIYGNPLAFRNRAKDDESYLDGPIGRIKLTRGLWAIVDAEDFDKVKQHLWNAGNRTSTPYATANNPDGNGALRMHRVVMNAPPGTIVDHINHDTLDNRKCNLRVTTTGGNMKNKRAYRNNKSGHTGVDLHRGKYWRARIQSDGEMQHLGLFPTKEEAIISYRQAAIKLGFLPNW